MPAPAGSSRVMPTNTHAVLFLKQNAPHSANTTRRYQRSGVVIVRSLYFPNQQASGVSGTFLSPKYIVCLSGESWNGVLALP